MKTECSLCSPKSYGTLELTTFADYWDMLNCVPPRHQGGGRFVVGEEYADRWQFGGEFPDETANRPVYDCYFAVEGNGHDENDTYVHGYFTIADYKAVTQTQLREATTIITLEITETRPERLRVVKSGVWFLVQSNRPGESAWVTQKEHANQQDAVTDAETWYCDAVAIPASKPTPGPWYVSPTADPDNEFCVTDDCGTILCRFDLWEGGAEQEQEANAKLIAASPELRTMLERLLDGVLRLPELPPTVSLLDIEQCQNAIAKSYV